MEVISNSPLPEKLRVKSLVPLVLLALFVVIFFSTFEGLYFRWIKWDEGLSHGLLVNAVFIYLLVKSLPWQHTTDTKMTAVLLYLGLALASLSWFIFRLANIYLLEQLALLYLLAGLYACSYGLKTAFAHRLLLLLPIFTIPLWEQLNDLLVNLSGFVVGKLVQMINMPAVIEGNSIFIPYGHIVIADGCSGLRYFEIALALGFIIGLLNNYTEKRLAPTLLVAALLGLAANWIRIFVLVIIGNETKMQSSLMANHEYFGWALFGLMCLPAIYFAPIVAAPKKLPILLTHHTPRILIPLCVLALGPLLSLFFSATPVPSTLEKTLAPQSEFMSAAKMPVAIVAPANSLRENASLSILGVEVFVQVNQYQRIHKEDKLVPHIVRLHNSEEWASTSHTIKISNHNASVTRFKQKTSDLELVQLQWLEVGRYKTDSIRIAKLLQIAALVRGQNTFKIVTLQSACHNQSCDQATAAILEAATTVFREKPSYSTQQ
jgi:exosortase